MSDLLEKLRDATRGTEYEGNLYLVGGVLRDRALGLHISDDIDLVLEGDAVALAEFLHKKGLSEHYPVTYPRFGTAMVTIEGHLVELVSARLESYDSDSRKPYVSKATIKDDAFRRDFTINTIMENLHTGEVLDLTGKAFSDLKAGIIRTPLEPKVTFYDDPLRMLRAVRFAVRLGFEIEPATWNAILEEASRLNIMGPEPPVVSAERIRDEFTKTIMSPDPARGLELLREAGLLRQFFPELLEMVGVTQNAWHLYDVWEHTMAAMRTLPTDATLEVRMGVLLHDIGKPATRSEDERGVHFYEHQFVGAEIARKALNRLKFTGEQIRDIVTLVELHMRLGEAKPEWSDSAVKRLIRAVYPYTDQLFLISQCDMAAMRQDVPHADLPALRARIDALNEESNVAKINSPLDGLEIMQVLGIPPGPQIKAAKEFLTNEILDGRLAEGDKTAARELLLKSFLQAGKKQIPPLSE
jgi:poly(A) polymerase